MIISPPFLPVRAAGQSEESWLGEAMRPTASRLPDTHAAEGSFPLSHSLCWHNGIHIQAPTDNGGNLPVRAVADGIVRFAHQPAPANTRVDDPQNYNPFQRGGAEPTPAWTDNGCVIIEHSTAIGATGAAETQVTYYSLYMHLSELGRRSAPGQTSRPYWVAGDRIWRKDIVGQPGRVYGHGGQIHFELGLNEVSLRTLIGRAPSWVEPGAMPTADGRRDSVFGSLYVFLPATTPSATMEPAQAALRASGGATLGAPTWVRMTYAHGACTLDSFDVRGVSLGSRSDNHGEGSLYTSAERSHSSLPPSVRANSSVSSWYELYRFGRVLGYGTGTAERDPLPANAAHWRQIIGPQRTSVWADLNAEGTFKLSDADFPSIAGWNFFDDDATPADQRCDSPRMRSLLAQTLGPNENGSHEALARRLGDSDVQRTLRRAWCRFPNEWNREDIATRYRFVCSLAPFVESADAWPRFEAHLTAMTFAGLPAICRDATWHGHPVEFIAHMRKCGWLSIEEGIQTVPRSLVAEDNRSRTLYRTTVTHLQATARIRPISIDLNRVMRKYLIESRQRQACFLANAMVESTLLSQFYEGGRGAGHPYGDWYGRGIIQLTWQAGYLGYFAYRGRATGNAANDLKWRNDVETDSWDRCDSAGFWWVRNGANATADPESANQSWQVSVCEDFNWHTHQCRGALTRETRLQNSTLERVGRHVNTGSPTTTHGFNGLPERQDIFIHVQAILMETFYPSSSGALVEMHPLFFTAQR